MTKKSQKQVVNLLIAFCLLIQNTLNAECIYEKNLQVDEFPIGVRLAWSTSFEHNTSVFILEKQDNTQTFQSMGSLEAAGNSKSIKEYKFLDNRAMSSTISYRIKQMDIDGTYSYSETVTIHKKIEGDIAATGFGQICQALVYCFNDYNTSKVSYSIAGVKLKNRTADYAGLDSANAHFKSARKIL